MAAKKKSLTKTTNYFSVGLLNFIYFFLHKMVLQILELKYFHLFNDANQNSLLSQIFFSFA